MTYTKIFYPLYHGFAKVLILFLGISGLGHVHAATEPDVSGVFQSNLKIKSNISLKIYHHEIHIKIYEIDYFVNFTYVTFVSEKNSFQLI